MLTILVLIGMFINFLKTPKIKKGIREFVSVTGLSGIIISIVFINVAYLVKNILPYFKVTMINLSASYDWRMEHEVGFFYNYTMFINKYTPDSALILHPKMQSRWPEVSNEGYTRYFVYPRDLVAEDGDELKKEKITHIFIIGRKNLDGVKNLDPWPTVKIPAKRLIYAPLGLKGEVTILEKDYSPSDEINDRWGIIELEN